MVCVGSAGHLSPVPTSLSLHTIITTAIGTQQLQGLESGEHPLAKNISLFLDIMAVTFISRLELSRCSQVLNSLKSPHVKTNCYGASTGCQALFEELNI